jgi:hypothetical protein
MANLTPSFKPGSVTISGSGAQNVDVSELVLTLANTEYSFAFKSGLKEFILRARNLAQLKFSFETGGDYMTIKEACVLELTGLEFTAKSIYIQSPVEGTTVEILELY